MGHRRPPVRKASSASKRRSSGGQVQARSRVQTRAQADVTQARLRRMATRELLRRAALATPLLGGILILGLLAISVARGPSRPDTVVGSTTTAAPHIPAAEEAPDEVASAGETVTAGPEDDDGDHSHLGPSGSDSSGSDDAGSSGSDGDEPAAGDGHRTSGATDRPMPGDHHRPRHGQPEHEDDHDDGERRGDEPDEAIEVAVGLPDPGRSGHDGDRHDGDRHDRNDGTVSVDVGIGPVNVSANVGRPPSRTSPPHHDRAGRPHRSHGPGPKATPAAKPSAPHGSGHGKSSTGDRDPRGGTSSAATRISVIVIPVPVPVSEAEAEDMTPESSRTAELWPPDESTDPADDPATEDGTATDGTTPGLTEPTGRGALDRIGDEAPEEETADDARDVIDDRATEDGAPQDAGAPADAADDDADSTAPAGFDTADDGPAVEAETEPADPASFRARAAQAATDETTAPPAIAEDASPDPAPPAAVESVVAGAVVPIASPAVQDSDAPSEGCTDCVGVPPEHTHPTTEAPA